MIWILLATYFLGGGPDGINGSLLTTQAVKQLSGQADVIVDDPERLAAVQEIFSELKSETKAFEKAFTSSGKQLTKSYKEYAADKAQALAILDQLDADWEVMQLGAIELRFELREQVTEDEWGEIFTQE